MNDREQLAKQAIDEILLKMNSFDEVGVQHTLQLLEQLRLTLLHEITDAMTLYERNQLSQILTAFDDAINVFTQRYSLQVAALQAQGFVLGQQVVTAPLTQLTTLGLVAPRISQTLLEVSQAYSADLIRGLSASIRTTVSNELRAGILIGRKPSEVMTRIGFSINKGKFRSISERAATITRTEANRVMGLATHAQLLQTAHLGLKQQWSAANDARTRPAHQAADGEVVEPTAAFKVGGEELRFPGDPAGSAWNTINCRCRVLPWSSSWQDVTPYKTTE